MIKIWGTAFSLIGDLIMSLPQLNYYKSKYKDIYVTFVIHKKISYCAPLFFNHPLIDKIYISGEWSSFNEQDYNLASKCDIITTNIDHVNKKIFDREHPEKNTWYNTRSCIEQNALVSGIDNLNDYLSEKEKYPFLNKWFDEGFDLEQKKGAYTYKKKENKSNFTLTNSISIWPFAGYGRSKNRNPDPKWWSTLVDKFAQNKIHVYHFGYINEPTLSSNANYYHNLTHQDFFSQIKISLGTKMSLGTDSGSMWTLSAYSHPTLVLLTNWAQDHNENYYAFNPINLNGDTIFLEGGFHELTVDQVFQKCLDKGVKKANQINRFINYLK